MLSIINHTLKSVKNCQIKRIQQATMDNAQNGQSAYMFYSTWFWIGFQKISPIKISW